MPLNRLPQHGLEVFGVEHWGQPAGFLETDPFGIDAVAPCSRPRRSQCRHFVIGGGEMHAAGRVVADLVPYLLFALTIEIDRVDLEALRVRGARQREQVAS